MRSITTGLALAALLPLVGRKAEAQRGRPKPRTAATITITGQVPTPQVVTVRPRQEPAFSRAVLVPKFFAASYWPSVASAYAIVPQRQVRGGTPLDTAAAAVAAVGVPPEIARPGSAQAVGGAAAAAPPAGSREAEIQALQKELELHKRVLDSLAKVVQGLGRPDTTRRPPPDSSVRPPSADSTRPPQRAERAAGAPATAGSPGPRIAESTARQPADITRRSRRRRGAFAPR